MTAKFLLQTVCIFFLYLFPSPSLLFSQVKFSASVSSNVIGKNERLQVEFKAENANVEDIIPPKFNGFIVESGPMQQSGMTVVNGDASRYFSLSYILRPLKKGKIVIGAATAKLDGKFYKSNQLSIQVTENSQGSNVNPYSPFGGLLDVSRPQAPKQYNDYILKKGENLQEKIARNLFVKVDVDKTSCYVGEPVIATYKLYTRLKSESNLSKSPSFNGFSVLDLDVGNNFELRSETVNGRDYSVYILRKVQLYPLQEGQVELEPCEVDNNITFLKSEYASALGMTDLQDLLLSFSESSAPREALQTERISIQSKPLMITVKALPANGKPAGFKGAVGNFKMTSWLVKPNMTTDDAGNLRINISGSGNLHLINAPAVEWPQGLEGFEPKSTETLDKTTVPVSGEKQYAFPFTVRKEGSYTIAPFEFSYFNPVTSTYKVLNSPALKLDVSKGRGLKASNPNATPTSKVEAMDVLKVLLYIAIGLGVLVAITVLFLNRRKNQTDKNEAKLILEEAVDTEPVIPEPVIPVSPLIIPQEKLTEGDATGFFQSLNFYMKEHLSKRLKIPSEDLNKKRINEALDRHGVNVHTSQLVCSLLDDIELNLYAAPLAAHVQMQEVYEKANEVLGLLDKQLHNA